MRRALILLLAVAFVLAMAGVAVAVPDSIDSDVEADDSPITFYETPYANTYFGPQQPPWGASRWTYKDSADGSAYKTEGSYRKFDDTGAQLYTVDPHGNYSTTSNKCKTCHAVHRATGAYRLLRVDKPDDVCNYCHIGDHKHSNRGAYYRGDGTVYPRNGHTIGAGKEIPDSSVSQWLNTSRLVIDTDDDGTPDTAIPVREYNTAKNKIFKITQKYISGSGMQYVRIGPTYLSCMSCHQVHRATNLIWRPTGSGNGYKLLRNSPSGSVKDANKMANYTPWDDGSMTLNDVIKVVEDTLSSSNTGWPNTIYTQWQGSDVDLDQNKLSVFCVDCHNLNIGIYRSVAVPNYGTERWHGDRTHSVPYSRYDCYSCHQGDMPEQYYNNTYSGIADTSDWPHSAATFSTKLLGDDYVVTSDWQTGGTTGTWDPVANEHIDRVCIRCHDTIGVSQ